MSAGSRARTFWREYYKGRKGGQWLIMNGLSRDDLDKPFIGIANTWNEIVPGHLFLKEVSKFVKDGIKTAGGAALEFNTIATCDGYGYGYEKPDTWKYCLPIRDVTADSVEMIARHTHFDGMVLLSACDKSNPGMQMAAARLDVPSILVPAGLNFLRCPGTGLGTATTGQCMSEALGMALPRTATTYTLTPAHEELARRSGMMIVELVRSNMRPSQIMTHTAFENAIRVLLATGGSANYCMHLPAIANELDIEIGIDDFDKLSDETPYLSHIRPNGLRDLQELDQKGGILGVMKELSPLLDIDVMTCTSKSLGENIKNFDEWMSIQPATSEPPPDTLRPFNNPILKTGGITALRGSLAPDGSIIRTAGVKKEKYVYEGSARVFENKIEATEALLNEDYEVDDVIVVRNEGPKGGPGMPELCSEGEMLGTEESATYLITDGRYSGGGNAGTIVGFVTPEAFEGGPIAIVKDGDKISIDIPKKRLDLLLPEQEIKARLEEWKPPKPRFKKGFLGRYVKEVTPALKGAYLRPL
ncbi:MAG: dihydroxy-acid dehydratase domain-containing protein [Promethearchaeota archaeon]